MFSFTFGVTFLSVQETITESVIMVLSFWTDRSKQTVQEQSDQGVTVCHFISIYWIHFSMVEPPYSNFRIITAIFYDVQIFSDFFAILTFCHW